FAAEVIVNADRQSQWQAAGILPQMLEPLNIQLTVTRVPASRFFARLNQSDFQLALVGWVGLTDPDERLYAIFHSKGAANQQNYHNEQVDELLEQARQTADTQQRGNLYREAQRLIAQDAPVVFLYLNE